MDKSPHTEQWFIDRVGKTIYRKKLSCPCDVCQKESFIISDKSHALYVYDCQIDMQIRYEDKPLK